jgi:type II secretory pathway pseudopilin PulG
MMIVIAILGILGAVVVPTYQGHSLQTKQSAVTADLNALRMQIEVYKSEHNGQSPGFVNGMLYDGETMWSQLMGTSTAGGVAIASTVPSDSFPYGPYIRSIPQNPFNDLKTVVFLPSEADFSGAADGQSSGWLCKPGTGEIRLNWTGADSDGLRYVDY